MSDSKPTLKKRLPRSTAREPRITIRKGVGTTWRDKVHPFLIRAAEHRKTVHRLMESASPEDRRKAQDLIRHQPDDLRKEARAVYEEQKGKLKYPTAALLYSLQDYPEGIPLRQSKATLAWFCLYQFGKPIDQLIREYKSGDWKAAKQVNRLRFIYDQLRFGRLDVTKLRLKVDEPHFSLMALGLNFGLDAMTAEELADCYDALCVCGKPHTAESLGKLRWRMIRMLEKLASSST